MDSRSLDVVKITPRMICAIVVMDMTSEWGKLGREIENLKRTGVEGANGTLAASNGMTGAAADPRFLTPLCCHHHMARADTSCCTVYTPI
jgi:hypothetical protein